MSYGVVRVQKMGSGSVKGIQIHDRREKDGVSHTNQDIDWSRADQNYDIAPAQIENFTRAVKDRIDQLNLPRAVRKDAVVMAQVLVTSDRGFFDRLDPEQTRKFFEDSYNFLADRYGRDNIISATVHMDEKTPHMHFNFVPVTPDGRLSAKSVLTRQALIKQQDDFYLQVGKKYDLQRGIQGGKKKHLETADFKRKTLQDEIKQLTSHRMALKSQIEGLQGVLGQAQGITHLNPQKTLTGAIKGISVEEIEKLKSSAIKGLQATDELKQVRKSVQQQERAKETRLQMAQDVSNLKMQNRQLQGKIEELRADMAGVLEVFEQKPELYEAYKQAVEEINREYEQQLQEHDRGEWDLSL